MREKQNDTPLPATVAFVFVLGLLFFGGWFLMYHLLVVRW